MAYNGSQRLKRAESRLLLRMKPFLSRIKPTGVTAASDSSREVLLSRSLYIRYIISVKWNHEGRREPCFPAVLLCLNLNSAYILTDVMDRKTMSR